MLKGQLGNFSTMSGGEFSVAGGATDDWYISKGAQYRWGTNVITISVYYNDIMHSLCILRGLSPNINHFSALQLSCLALIATASSGSFLCLPLT